MTDICNDARIGGTMNKKKRVARKKHKKAVEKQKAKRRAIREKRPQ